MIDLLVPYKKDSVERANNKVAFLNHYASYYNVVLIEDYNSRAEAFNIAASESTSEYIALADIDGIVPYKSMNSALFMLAGDNFDMVYPFDKIMNEHPDGTLTDDWPKPFIYGIMVCFKREKFLEFGGENEEFNGYGWEDLERYYRALNAGFKVGRVEDTCNHLIHHRSGFENPYFNHNMNLMNKEKQKWKKQQ
jgi:GT2 family glycosyltransferase